MQDCDFELNCSHIADHLRRKYGSKALRIILAGSRAKRTARKNSDWDVIIILEDEPSGKFGPIRLDDKFTALDGNPVEYFRMSNSDFSKFRQAGNQFICDADEFGILL